MFDEAIHRACELDEHLERTGKPIGPLHGLPISVKEHIYLKGSPHTAGCIAWADDVAEEDALIVRVLREAGAVFHVKTTNPQGLMALETVSNIYGRTTNPHNRFLSPGGSSGGEGALIAMRGSVLGIGTDMGQSSCFIEYTISQAEIYFQVAQFVVLLHSLEFTASSPLALEILTLASQV
jgi:amidase